MVLQILIVLTFFLLCRQNQTMQNHKLILILKALTQKELNAFVRMANTPYFNRKEEVVLLIGYLKKQYPKFSENSVEKGKIFKVISKEKVFNNRFLDDTVYNTIKLIEQFLVIENLNNDNYSTSKVLTKELKNRKLTDLALKEIEKSKKLLAKNNLNLNTDSEWYSLNLNEYLYKEASYKDEDLVPLISANKSIDLYYWKNKLWLNDEVNSRSEISNELVKILDNTQIDEINVSLLQNDNDIISNTLSFLNTENTSFTFENIFEEIKQSYKILDSQILILFVSNLINYCKKQYSKTQELIYTKYWFEVYQFGYERGIFVKYNKINDTSFLNTVHLGLVHKEYKWVSFFINDYKNHLSDTMLFNLSSAMLNFELKNYAVVLQVLLEINFGHIHQNLTARSLIAKTYFEMKEYDLLDSHLKAYEIYLRRHIELSEQLKQINLNFVAAVKKLALAQFDKKALVSLQKDLEEKPIAYKSWFMSLL